MLRRTFVMGMVVLVSMLGTALLWPGRPATVQAQSTAAGGGGTAVVQARGLNVRSDPRLGSAVVGVVKKGDQLTVLGRSSNKCDWLLVRTDALQGWVSGGAQYVTLGVPCSKLPLTTAADAPPAATATPTSAQAEPGATPSSDAAATPPAGDAEVLIAALNMRTGPTAQSGIGGVVRRGDMLKVLKRSDEKCSWLYVVTPDGVEGWVAGAPQFIRLRLACAALELAAPPALATAVPPATAVPTAVPTPTATSEQAGGDGASGEAAGTSDCPNRDRLQTGVYKWYTSTRDVGQLEIKNGLATGLVMLKTINGEPVVVVFLQKDATFTVTGLPLDVYKLEFVEGTVDCSGRMRGTLSAFPDTLDFRSGDWSITLYGTSDGTVAPATIDDDFELQL